MDLQDDKEITEEYAYKMGKDSHENGANERNCDFRLFSRPELTRAWEKGNSGKSVFVSNDKWKEEFRKRFTAGGLMLAFNPEIIEKFIEELLSEKKDEKM